MQPSFFDYALEYQGERRSTQFLSEMKVLILFDAIEKVLSSALQRGGSQKEEIIDFGSGVFFNLTTQEISTNGTPISLGKKERELLAVLVAAHPKTVGAREIEWRLWPMESVGDSALKNMILRIRKKLGEEIILSVKGAGYRVTLSGDLQKPSQGRLI